MRFKVGQWFRLRPVALRALPNGLPLPRRDDPWFVRAIQWSGIELLNGRTDHVVKLTWWDLIAAAGPSLGGSSFHNPGTLTIRKRILLSGYHAWTW